MAISPTMRRRRLASIVKRQRESAGIAGKDLAKKIGMSQPALSRAENARESFTPTQLEKAIKVLGFDVTMAEELRILRRDGDELGWWEEQYSDVLPSNIEMLIGLEAGASWERTYQEAYVPGLLQTPDYAKAIISSAAPFLRSADIPRLVELRMQRQSRLDDDDFRLTAVVNEGALRRWVGGRDVMHAQIEHLIDVARKRPGQVEILVLPYEAGEHPAQGQSFVLLGFPDPEDSDVIFLDYAHSSGFLEKPAEIRQHTSAFGVVMSKALDVEASIEKLMEIEAMFEMIDPIG